MSTLQKKQTEKTMARTRFDDDQTLVASNKKDSQINKSEIEKVELLMAAKQKSKNPNTAKYIDPNLDPKYAISRIQLPPSTMYMIDKVVRQKAAQGPIGVNNSEVINLEQERELRKKNIYYANLAGKKGGKSETGMDEDPEDMEGEVINPAVGRNSKGEFIDDEEIDMDEQEKENARNEALLQRLYNVAKAEI